MMRNLMNAHLYGQFLVGAGVVVGVHLRTLQPNLETLRLLINGMGMWSMARVTLGQRPKPWGMSKLQTANISSVSTRSMAVRSAGFVGMCSVGFVD
jgi:hypothetical protein